MLGRCAKCRKIRSTGLPSDHNSKWLEGPSVPVEFYCGECYWQLYAASGNRILDITYNDSYLIRYEQVVPLLATIAFIIMVCLEIAWHS